MTNQNAGLQTLLQFFSINTASIPERWMRFLHYPHFWYPSSGFDTKPLELAVSNTFPFWDIQTLFLYVDRQEVFTHPDQLRKITNRKNTVPIPASENYHVEVVSCLSFRRIPIRMGPLFD